MICSLITKLILFCEYNIAERYKAQDLRISSVQKITVYYSIAMHYARM